jgi:hypothetical protein
MLFCRVVFNCASSCSVAGLISSLLLSLDIWMSSRLCSGAISWFSAAKRTPALCPVAIVTRGGGEEKLGFRALHADACCFFTAALVVLAGGKSSVQN